MSATIAVVGTTFRKLAAAAALAAIAFVWGEQPSECHEGHCHGDKVCGGGWKDYRDSREHTGPEAGADSASEACSEAADELEEALTVAAYSRCPELHPCGSCPKDCSGCSQQSPTGSVDKVISRTPREADDGSWECTLKVEALFRCRCGDCLSDNK